VPGPTGPAGATGATGPAGPGVPTGGTVGQVLTKSSATDYATGWTTPPTTADLWTTSGAVLTPTDPTKAVSIVQPAYTPAIVSGGTGRAMKTRFYGNDIGNPLSLRTNNDLLANVLDDVTKPAWLVQVESADVFSIWRAPAAGGAPVFVNLLKLDAAGNLTVIGAEIAQAATGNAVKNRWISTGGAEYQWRINANAAAATDDPSKAAWSVRQSCINDNFAVFRAPAAATAAFVALLTLDATGAIRLPMMPGTGSVIVGSGSGTTRITSTGMLSANAFWSGTWQEDDTSKPGWLAQINPASDNITFQRMAAGNGALTTLFTLDAGWGLTLAGSGATKATGTTWNNPSDRRIKKHIVDYGAGLAAILALRPVQFEYNGCAGTTDGAVGFGYIADEVAPVLPEAVTTRRTKLHPDDADDVDLQILDTSNVTLALVNAVKTLEARVAALEAAAAAPNG
jgi:hypothetical protein